MSRMHMFAAAAALAGLGLSGQAHAAGDAVKGKVVFARCAICHDVKPGVNKLGPSLAGVVGRKSGSVAGFAYSGPMKMANKQWTAQNLDAFVTAPFKFIPGTRMAFGGIPNPADRANLIAYLQTVK